MSSRSRKRKRTVTSEVELEEATSTRGEGKPSEEEDELAQDAPTARPSRNRRKSAKLAEAEGSVKSPSEEPRRLGVISLHHEKGGKKDSGDSWTITSSNKPRRKSAPPPDEEEEDEEEEKSQLLHIVSKGKQQTIKIKPLLKPEAEGKPTSSRSTKKSQRKALPPLAVKEDSGIKLKLILSPKDKGKETAVVGSSEGSKDKRTASWEKSGKPSTTEKEEQTKAKFVFGDQVLRLQGDKIVLGSKKRKHDDTETESSDSPATSKGNKKKKTAPTEEQPTPQKAGRSTSANKSGSKLETKTTPSDKSTSKGGSKNSKKTLDKPGQGKSDNRSKAKVPEETNSQSLDTSKSDDKSKKKKSRGNKTGANFNLLSLNESVDDLVIDESLSESPKKVKSDKPKSDKKKKANDSSDSSHKSKKHKSKDPKKQKAKFINTGTKKPGRIVGLDPVSASQMFGQFDSFPSQPQSNLEGPGLDDESFFMAGSDATIPSFPDPNAIHVGIPELSFPQPFGKNTKKKNGKKFGKKSEKDKRKKKKKDKLKKEEKSKKPLSAYMLWCGQTRRKVVAQNPGLDFSGISRMMGTLWQQLPEKERQIWYSKQRQQNVKHKNVPSLSKQKFHRPSSSGKGSRSPHGSPVRHFAPRIEPIDSAAHLKLLGESLMLVGDRLQSHVGQVEVHGSLSVLLDSTLCSLAPLMALTSQVPELNSIDKEALASTMDNIAYIMPGLG